MDIWGFIQTLRGRSLRTLERGNMFEILDVSESGVIIRPNFTGK
jgi:hypothetical protein